MLVYEGGTEGGMKEELTYNKVSTGRVVVLVYEGGT